jgi:abequosyltransferase
MGTKVNPNNIKLCISIPTYNRANYLNRVLSSIQTQLKEDHSLIVNIFDNNSTDQTKEIVASYLLMNPRIFMYYKNESTIDGNLNIAQCYYNSQADYTMVLGDDDVLLDGCIEYILQLLSSGLDYGLIFLNYYSFSDNLNARKPKRHQDKINDVFLLSKDSLLKIAGTRIGFISASIINTNAIIKDDLVENYKTSLGHIIPIVKSMNLGYKNIYIHEYFLAQQAGNSTILNYFKLFGEDFPRIYRSLVDSTEVIQFFETDLILLVFPAAIVKAKRDSNHEFNHAQMKKVLKNFSHRMLYWVTDFPLIYLPKPADKAFLYLIVIVGKLYATLKVYSIVHKLR